MKVLFASSEVFPFSKTGGLADVSAALPLALKRKGVDVSVATPLYRGIAGKYKPEATGVSFSIPLSDFTASGELFAGSLNGELPVYFVDCPEYFDREELYTRKNSDYHDNAERFIFFSRIIVELAIREGFDVLHLNDWQTAMAAVYAKSLYNWSGKVVLTIHNLGYQGIFWHYDMHLTNLGWDFFNPGMLEFWGNINFLKGGIYFSDAITTVSPRYAEEILEEEHGFGLNGVLGDVKTRLKGILNGIDYDVWSPRADRYIVEQFGTGDVTKKKKLCRKDLLSAVGLTERAGVPVFGMISRLAAQKGWDLIEETRAAFMERDMILVILGRGDSRYEEMLFELRDSYPEKVSVTFSFSDELAHKIEAGSDFFLMPSRYEPCGLNQMISMKYGTVPVVRAVGGLDDTVTDVAEGKNGTGIKFSAYTGDELIGAVDRALALYRDPLKLSRVRKAGMKKDFSWSASAGEYLKLYGGLTGKR